MREIEVPGIGARFEMTVPKGYIGLLCRSTRNPAAILNSLKARETDLEKRRVVTYQSKGGTPTGGAGA